MLIRDANRLRHVRPACVMFMGDSFCISRSPWFRLAQSFRHPVLPKKQQPLTLHKTSLRKLCDGEIRRLFAARFHYGRRLTTTRGASPVPRLDDCKCAGRSFRQLNPEHGLTTAGTIS